jgi:uncharacterized membrane protein YjfL (UPF0719 family)
MTLIIGFLELILTIVMAVLVVYVTLRALIRTNTDFDEDEEILKNNVAVGLLVAALLLAAANIMHQAFKPVIDTAHLILTSPLIRASEHWKVGLYAVGNLVLAYFIVVSTLSFSLRLFGRLARTKDTRPGIELEKGNVAIGIILSSFVLVISMFVGEGVKALSKAIIPKPSVGAMHIMR